MERGANNTLLFLRLQERCHTLVLGSAGDKLSHRARKPHSCLREGTMFTLLVSGRGWNPGDRTQQHDAGGRTPPTPQPNN